MTSTSSAPDEGKKRQAVEDDWRIPPTRRFPRAPRALREAGHFARKGLGQHFLRDRRILQRIVRAAKLSPDDTVVEVGAGLGTLTALLAKRAARVVAVEVDEELCDHLRQRFAETPNLSLVCADVLSLTPSQLLREAGASPPYVVVANLPYYIAAPVLRFFLEATAPPSRLVVMVQKEVAESIVAGPGKTSLLGMSVQFYASPRLLFTVPPSAFYPPPKVQSAVLRLDVRARPAVEVEDTGGFFRFVRAGFSAPRKQLRNALSHALGASAPHVAATIAEAGVDPRVRAQALGLEDWARLYGAFSASGLHKSGGTAR
ncbi:MAG: 16S rRNA (adenine(1518)-N(6)/adenine(1519)-N(6))-dimethyltransferase RsmA [Dehalococcoidia bacterium]|nr:16S rRNA (adenine(1518)-N(6)/adenine(1519)-N(6))-dimethyltransferase RsmA [Dehalococcoidia bacterium]